MTCAKNKLGASSDLNVKIIKTQNVKRVKKIMTQTKQTGASSDLEKM